MLDGELPPELALLRIKTEMKLININCTHLLCLSFDYNKNKLTFMFPIHVIHT